MKYICHKKYNKKAACGEELLVCVDDELETVGPFIAQNEKAVCAITSEDAYVYFARNDDGNGRKRGNLTYKIAYAPRHPNKDNGFRFTEEEIEMLEENYSKYLRKDSNTIIFNYDFFNASIEDLQEIYNRLEES